MSDIDELLNDQLKDPEFAAAWEATELEYQIQWFNAVQIILNFIDDLRRRI